MKRIVTALSMGLVVLAGFSGTCNAGDFRFPVRLTYLQSISDVVDWHEEQDYQAEVLVPVGISFAPYYEFDYGLQIWGDLGPVSAIMGDVSYLNIPLSVGVGYAILPKFNVSPYLKAGLRYPIASGDYVEGSKPGAVFAFGVEFLRKKVVGIQVEFAYDTSGVEFSDGDSSGYYDSRLRRYVYGEPQTETIKGGFMVSVGAVF